MWLFDWTEIWYGKVSRLEEHAHKILCDLHKRFGRCFSTGRASCTYRGNLARCGIVGGDPSETQRDWLVHI